MQATTGRSRPIIVSNAQYSVTGNNPDTDGDGLPDSYEQTIIDANPAMPSTDWRTSWDRCAPAVTDFDDDGASDAQEYANGTNPLDSDSDDDGLLDGVEDDTVPSSMPANGHRSARSRQRRRLQRRHRGRQRHRPNIPQEPRPGFSGSIQPRRRLRFAEPIAVPGRFRLGGQPRPPTPHPTRRRSAGNSSRFPSRVP